GAESLRGWSRRPAGGVGPPRKGGGREAGDPTPCGGGGAEQRCGRPKKKAPACMAETISIAGGDLPWRCREARAARGRSLVITDAAALISDLGDVGLLGHGVGGSGLREIIAHGRDRSRLGGVEDLFAQR